MYCYKCGKEISDESTFCCYCGHKLDLSTSSEKDKKYQVLIIVLSLIAFMLIAIGILLIILNNAPSDKDNTFSKTYILDEDEDEADLTTDSSDTENIGEIQTVQSNELWPADKNGYYIAKNGINLYELIINPDFEENYCAIAISEGDDLVAMYEGTFEYYKGNMIINMTDNESNTSSELYGKIVGDTITLESAYEQFEDCLYTYTYLGDSSTVVDEYIANNKNVGELVVSEEDDYPYISWTFYPLGKSLSEAVAIMNCEYPQSFGKVGDKSSINLTYAGMYMRNDDSVDICISLYNGLKDIFYIKDGRCIAYIRWEDSILGTYDECVKSYQELLGREMPEPIEEHSNTNGLKTWRIDNGYMTFITTSYPKSGVQGIAYVSDKKYTNYLNYPLGSNPLGELQDGYYGYYDLHKNRQYYIGINTKGSNICSLLIYDKNSVLIDINASLSRDSDTGHYMAVITDDNIGTAPNSIGKELSVVPIPNSKMISLNTSRDYEVSLYVQAERLTYVGTTMP